MKKSIIWTIVGVLLVLSLMSCDNNEEQKEIDAKYHGKWEIQRMQNRTDNLPLPVVLNGELIKAAGYIITATSIERYYDGIPVFSVSNVYSKHYEGGESEIMDLDSDLSVGFSLNVEGQTLEWTQTYPFFKHICTKVSRFSWE